MKHFKIGMVVVGMACGISTAVIAQDTPRPAKVTVVAPVSQASSWRYSAIVIPSREVELSFKVSGQVVELPVRGAMSVAEGDVIAKLDPRNFEAAVDQLNSQREQSVAQLTLLREGARPEELAALEAAVEAGQAQVDQARDNLERTRQLTERGVTTTAKLEQDASSLRVAEANLQAQREQLAIGRSGGRPEEIAAAEAALRGLDSQIDTARRNLDDATLRAPFAGTIARRDIQNFSNVQAGQSIALLQTLSTVDLLFDVPGSDVVSLARRDDIHATAIFPDLPGQALEAELVEFSTQADAATQTYRGRVSVQIPDKAVILPGMAGHITISTSLSEIPGVDLPLTALAANPDGSSYVWLVDPEGNSVSRREVALGNVAGANVRVVDGLEPGDMVVTAGIGALQDGMTVRPINKVGE